LAEALVFDEGVFDDDVIGPADSGEGRVTVRDPLGVGTASSGCSAAVS
jgi:hypothetical protein